MTNVEYFGESLYTILANKLIHEENPDSSEEKLDILKKNLGSVKEDFKYLDSTDNISRSVLMLSYAYRPLFRAFFLDSRVQPILMRAERNPMTYVRCFAKASHKKYSPFKFIIVCSFISEIFLFLSKPLDIKRKFHYIRQTTEALNEVFRCILENNFPQNEWTDIQKEASKIAKGFPFLEPFMNNEASQTNANQVADAIIRHADVVVAGTPLQKMVNANIPSIPSSQVSMNESEVPILSNDVLPTAYMDQNLVYTSEFPFNFGTLDEIPQLWDLLHVPDDQTEAVVFQNPSYETVRSFQEVFETAEPSKLESHAQGNLTVREPEKVKPESSRTVKLTESGDMESCAVYNPIISEQELIDGEAKYWKDFSASRSEDESRLSIQTVKKTESMEKEGCIEGSAVISEQELMDREELFWKNELYLSPKIEPIGDTIEGCSHGFEESEIDCRSETLSKEDDSESETFLAKGNAKDSASEKFSKENVNETGETFSKEENISTSRNAVSVSEIQTDKLCQRQANAALQYFTTNKAVSSQKNDAQQVNEIEINIPSDVSNFSEKVLHLNLGGWKFVVRMPADMSLIFKYNGQTSSPKKPQT